MTNAPAQADKRLLELVELWRGTCADFVALARDIPREQWDLPTDLAGWTVKDIVAHTAHLEAVLAGAPEETIDVTEAPHLKGLMNYYTEQGVPPRRARKNPHHRGGPPPPPRPGKGAARRGNRTGSPPPPYRPPG